MAAHRQIADTFFFLPVECDHRQFYNVGVCDVINIIPLRNKSDYFKVFITVSPSEDGEPAEVKSTFKHEEVHNYLAHWDFCLGRDKGAPQTATRVFSNPVETSSVNMSGPSHLFIFLIISIHFLRMVFLIFRGSWIILQPWKYKLIIIKTKNKTRK